MKKAIAYVSDVILGRSGEVISRDHQKEMIRRHAAAEGIEIIGWFEDEVWCEGITERPGVRQLLACGAACDGILVERVWAFSRQWSLLQPFLADLKARGRTVEAVTQLWDCVSQQTRDFNRGRKLQAPTCQCPPAELPAVAAAPRRPSLRPAHLHFQGLVGRVRQHA